MENESINVLGAIKLETHFMSVLTRCIVDICYTIKRIANQIHTISIPICGLIIKI